MQYIQFDIQCADTEQVEFALAYLSELPFEAFEERDTELIAWVQEHLWGPDEAIEMSSICEGHNWSFSFKTIEDANWNKAWEDNFEPVIIGNLAIIRAPFHKKEARFEYDVMIQPRMSFGTGHHATTKMMIESIDELELEGKSVLDFGCGTGILAIFAALKGAESVSGIDNEPPAVENSLENTLLNPVKHIDFTGETLEEINARKGPFDIILGNIQLNVLRDHAPILVESLVSGGILLASGVLAQNVELLIDHYVNYQLEWLETKQEAGWSCIVFRKI
jgi:ribosomal protein L11 methyltransferase